MKSTARLPVASRSARLYPARLKPAQTPLSLPQWYRAFALRRVKRLVVQKPGTTEASSEGFESLSGPMWGQLAAHVLTEIRIVTLASSKSKFTSGQAHFGVALLGIGLGLLSLVAWDNSAGLPWEMPRFWYGQRTTCLWIAMFCVAFGLYVVAHGPSDLPAIERQSNWQPTRRGCRFQTVILYTREDCHLCDEAFALLRRYAAYLPGIREVDIDSDPLLKQQWDTWVPVVEIDGKVRFKGRVSEMLLRRLIEGSPPA